MGLKEISEQLQTIMIDVVTSKKAAVDAQKTAEEATKKHQDLINKARTLRNELNSVLDSELPGSVQPDKIK